MAKKKLTQLSTTQEENAQAQQMLEHYHQIADKLRASENQQQAETTLTDINVLPEGAQIALLKDLSKEQHVDAADVLLALNQLSPIKNVRKEARRSLIKLQGIKIYPSWTPPLEQTPALSLSKPITTNPPRFWKGLATDTKMAGMVQLFLVWEEGEDYKDARVLGFLLDMLNVGVKDFFTELNSKHYIEKFITRLRAEMHEVPLKSCSLAEARNLLQQALTINTRHGKQLPADYRSHLSLIKQLILDAPDLEEESEETIDLYGLTPHSVVTTFVESWVNENYSTAYDLLSKNSPLCEGLTKDEWTERRDNWASQAFPDALEPCFIREREQPKLKLWLPTSVRANQTNDQKVIETGWSIELDKIPEGIKLPELPQATVIYDKTKRHWFWVSYTLIQEDGEWRIQHMTDEGLNAQNLSVKDLRAKVQGTDQYLQDFAQKHMAETNEEIEDEKLLRYLNDIVTNIVQGTYYTDILIKKLPLDNSLYAEAAGRMITIGHYERGLAYLLPLAQRFPEQRNLYLKRIGDVQARLSEQYFEQGDDERAERYRELAKEALQEVLTLENSAEAHISLAELLINENEQLDEAKDHLLQAKALITDPHEEAHIELHLGEIATEQEQLQDALNHYQRVVELQPDSSGAWSHIGETHEALGNVEEAETSYKRAIELEPDDEQSYQNLYNLYQNNDQPSKAVEIIKQGLVANPDSSTLHLYLAAYYIDNEDYDQAEEHIREAEELDPDSTLVTGYRRVLDLNKAKLAPIPSKPNKTSKKKRR
jgi:tetratricopeptide (TPR) repeat protein